MIGAFQRQCAELHESQGSLSFASGQLPPARVFIRLRLLAFYNERRVECTHMTLSGAGVATLFLPVLDHEVSGNFGFDAAKHMYNFAQSTASWRVLQTPPQSTAVAIIATTFRDET